jgi:hypothetical protein
VYGNRGKSYLKQRIKAYNEAARFSRWFLLVDLNAEAECAPPLKAAWLPTPARYMCFRVAVRAVETWLLADQEQITEFLGVPASKVPTEPERIEDPKLFMVNLARRSRWRSLREDMVPRPGSGRAVGPACSSRLIEFVSGSKARWRPDVASRCSESLRRCRLCLQRLLTTERRDASDAQ